MDLAGCDTGAFYRLEAVGELKLQAAVGVPEHLDRLGLEKEAEVSFQETAGRQTPVCVHDAGPVRCRYGIHSFGLVPVETRGEAIGILEVGRKRRDVLVGEAEMEALKGFLPYLALAVTDCRLQEELPTWQGNAEEILKAAERWAQP